MRHKSNNSDTGKRVSFYLNKQALTILGSSVKDTGIKPSHIVSGLLSMLSNTEINPQFNPIYRKVRSFFLRRKQEPAIQKIEEILSEFQDKRPFSKFDSEILSRFGEDTRLWTTQGHPSVAVLAVLNPDYELSILIGSIVALQINHAIEKIIVVGVYDLKLINPKYVLYLQNMGVQLAPLYELKSNLNLVLSEQDKERGPCDEA